jgi:VanZ family protein
VKKIIKYWLPVALWALVIFSFSSYSVGSSNQIYWKDFVIKKAAHVIEYAILTALTYRALKVYGLKSRNAALWAIFMSVVYGATDEYHQSFTPGREPRLRDVFFDTIGAVFSIYAIWNWAGKLPKKFHLFFKNLEII